MQLTLETLAMRVETLERKLSQLTTVSDPPGTAGDEQHNNPEAVARWIAAFDAIPPLQMTPDEESAWQLSRATKKQIDTAAFDRFAASLPKAAG
jgi:hypothetical protein